MPNAFSLDIEDLKLHQHTSKELSGLINVALQMTCSSKGVQDSKKYNPLILGSCRFILKSAQLSSYKEAADAISSFLFLYPFEHIKITFKLKTAYNYIEIKDFSYSRDKHSDHQESKPWGKVKILFENRSCGIYLLQIAPKNSIPMHLHTIMDESELILTPDLLLQHKPVTAGYAFHWEKNFPHQYENPSTVEQHILCIDSPAFIPADEVLVKNKPLLWPSSSSIEKLWQG